MATFDKATLVSGTAPEFSAHLDEDWTVNGNPHGGYLLALMARAAIEADGGHHPHAIASSATYVTPPVLGDATVTAETLRQGRSASQVRVRLTQDGTPRVDATFTLGTLREAGQTWVDAPPPTVRPFETCPRSPVSVPGTGVRVSMLDMVDQRIEPLSFGRGADTWETINQSGSGSIVGWLDFADGTPWDAISLLYASDAFPPATLTLGSVGWVPTLELTVYVRAIPAPGPLRVRQRVRALTGSVVDQVCEIWDSTDRVVVQASQLALVRLVNG